jgi:hypothetical protein
VKASVPGVTHPIAFSITNAMGKEITAMVLMPTIFLKEYLLIPPLIISSMSAASMVKSGL